MGNVSKAFLDASESVRKLREVFSGSKTSPHIPEEKKLCDYSVTELLEELEKRTKNDDLLSS